MLVLKSRVHYRIDRAYIVQYSTYVNVRYSIITSFFLFRHLAVTLVGILTTLTSLPAGFSIHKDDIPSWLGWIRYNQRSPMGYYSMLTNTWTFRDSWKTQRRHMWIRLHCFVCIQRSFLYKWTSQGKQGASGYLFRIYSYLWNSINSGWSAELPYGAATRIRWIFLFT